MGFMTCGFTSSKYNCFFGWLFMCFDGWSTIFVVHAYAFLWIRIFVGDMYLDMQYVALIAVTTHLCVFAFLVMLDFIFKSDEMFFLAQSSSTTGNITTTTTTGLMETNLIIPEEEDESCFKQNPWALYRKHYIIVAIKIIFVILDFVILGMFNDGWKCAYSKCD